MLNEVRLIGRLGQNPTVGKTDSGKQYVNLNVATWKNFKDNNGEWQQITTWHRVTIWGENKITFVKGDLVLVCGEIRTHEYTDKDGIKKYITEIIGFAKKLNFSEQKSNKEPQQEVPFTNENDFDEDLPF